MIYGMTKSRGLRVRRGSRIAWVTEQQGQHFCTCGCGAPIPIQAVHFNLGIPAYLHGHNTRIANPNPRQQPAPQAACECGCGELAAAGKRFISGHNSQGRRLSDEARQRLSDSHLGELNPGYGKKPANYRGWYRTPDGYIMRRVEGHPFAPRNLLFEHRIVVERHLRKTDPASEYLTEVDGVLYLRPDIQIHHLDGVKDNNKVSNLQPMTISEHTRWHHAHRHPHK
jgi:HNH endonuclease/NUMOD3 motif